MSELSRNSREMLAQLPELMGNQKVKKAQSDGFLPLSPWRQIIESRQTSEPPPGAGETWAGWASRSVTAATAALGERLKEEWSVPTGPAHAGSLPAKRAPENTEMNI